MVFAVLVSPGIHRRTFDIVCTVGDIDTANEVVRALKMNRVENYQKVWVQKVERLSEYLPKRGTNGKKRR